MPHEQAHELGPFSDDGYAVGYALGSVVLPKPSGEEESVLDRRQVLEDVESIIHEVRHPPGARTLGASQAACARSGHSRS